MIFFINHSGEIIKSVPSSVHQGSSMANEIYLVAPFANGTVATVCFLLPNGTVTPPREMSEATAPSALNGVVNADMGASYAVYSYALPRSVTAFFGKVTAQFYFYSQTTGSVLASSATEFTVEMGVASELPEEPSAEVWEEILSNLSSLKTKLNQGAYPARAIYAWNSEYAYGANEITFVPSVGNYGAFVKSLTENNLNHPPYEDGALQTQYWAEVVNFNRISEAYFNQLNEAIATAQDTVETSAQNAVQAIETRAQSAEAFLESAATEASEQIQAMLNAFWGIFNVTTITDRYATRETANGEQIIDGVNTNVLRISGDTVKSSNLLPAATSAGTTLAGITWTRQADGTVMANGTATAQSYFTVLGNTNKLLPAGTYYLSGCPSGGGWQSYRISIVKSNASGGFLDWKVTCTSTAPVSFTVAEGEYFWLALYVESGKTVNNLLFRPMISRKNNGANFYQPYFQRLKNARFQSITSANADETKTDGLSLETAVELAKYDTLYPEQNVGKRFSHTLTFDGSEGWILVSSGTDGYNYFRVSLTDLPLAQFRNHVNNIFEDYVYASEIASGTAGLYFSPNGDQILVYANYDTLEAFTSYLSSLSTAGKPLTVTYQTVEEQSSFEVNFSKPSYIAYAGGTETVERGDAVFYGAKCEITQEYLTYNKVEDLV